MAVGNVNPGRGAVAVASATAEVKSGAPAPKETAATKTPPAKGTANTANTKDAKDAVAEKVADKLVKDAFEPEKAKAAPGADPSEPSAEEIQAASTDGEITKKVAEKVVEKVVQKVVEKVVEAVVGATASALSSAVSSTPAPAPASSAPSVTAPAAGFSGQSAFTSAPAEPRAMATDAFEARGGGPSPNAQATRKPEHNEKSGGGAKLGTTGGGDGFF